MYSTKTRYSTIFRLQVTPIARINLRCMIRHGRRLVCIYPGNDENEDGGGRDLQQRTKKQEDRLAEFRQHKVNLLIG